jgi:hypothetical protein
MYNKKAPSIEGAFLLSNLVVISFLDLPACPLRSGSQLLQ